MDIDWGLFCLSFVFIYMGIMQYYTFKWIAMCYGKINLFNDRVDCRHHQAIGEMQKLNDTCEYKINSIHTDVYVIGKDIIRIQEYVETLPKMDDCIKMIDDITKTKVIETKPNEKKSRKGYLEPLM